MSKRLQVRTQSEILKRLERRWYNQLLHQLEKDGNLEYLAKEITSGSLYIQDAVELLCNKFNIDP